MLAQSHTAVQPSEAAGVTYTAASDYLKSLIPDSEHQNHKSMAQKVIVVAMAPHVIAVITNNFAEFAPRGSSVTFVLPDSFAAEADAALESIPEGGNCTFSVQYVDDGNPASIKVDREGGREGWMERVDGEGGAVGRLCPTCLTILPPPPPSRP